jgi:hypothetical protein
MDAPAALLGFDLIRPEGMSWGLREAAWVLLALPACLTGIGLAARRLPGMGRVRPALLPAFGLAAFVAAGGVLNLLALARPLVVGAILGAGFLAWASAAWRSRAALRAVARAGARAWPLVALAGAIVAFTAATQLAPGAYNWQDDLQKYFAHPVRMLETGTVFGSPLSSLGSESLGGVALVQGCVLLCLPLRAINGADAVLGLLLCLLPLVAIGMATPGLRVACGVAIASTVIIDPHYVNISALFLGSALIMAAVLLSSETRAPDGGFDGGSPASVALAYAALIALKPTFLLFSGPHLAATALAVALARRAPRAGIRWGALAAAFTACFAAPWLLLHLPHYLASTAASPGPRPVLLHRDIRLLGTDPMEMGLGGLRPFTVLALALAAFSCAGLRQRRGSAPGLAVALAAAVAAAAYPAMLFVFPRLIGYADADADEVRYFIPLAIGIFPLALWRAAEAVQLRASALSPAARSGLVLAMGLAPLVLFAGSAAGRLRDAVRYHSILPFEGSHSDALSRATEVALGSGKEARVRAIQDRIPAGASLVAWIYTPYFLDFARNRVFDAEIAGISNPWARFPQADYVLWEYRGYPDLRARAKYLIGLLQPVNRGRAAPLAAFEQRLSGQLLTGTVLFRDDEYVLVRTAGAGR